jgi:hypothetical protein
MHNYELSSVLESSVYHHYLRYVIKASKKVGLEVNTEKTKYTLISFRQNA